MRQHLGVERGERREGAALVRPADDGVDALGLGLALDLQEVELEHGEKPSDRGCGARPDQDRDAVALRLRFEPRREVHGVAEDRIVEVQVRAHVADDAGASVDADADLHGQEGMARGLGLGAALGVEALERLEHAQGRSQAFASCAASSSGAFQNAMMASPMYLSIVPLRSTMALVSGVNSRFIRWVRPCGSSLYCSEIVVKPRTSENSTVMTRSSPPSTSFSGDWASCSTSTGERYCPKAERIWRRSEWARR